MEDKERTAPGNCGVLHRNFRNPGPLRWINSNYSMLRGDVKWRQKGNLKKERKL
ncbi:MAG: hypothetical protein BWY95_02721 [Bacteroidetes bacterium ADurb.BinA104]|nr:MAG: hypothetical protein BWY95_02721 [Bacteroidetes bacterium ADurb.BinA104]